MINIDRSSSMLLTTMMLMLTTAQDHHRCCRRHSHHLDVDHRSHDLLSTLSLWKFIYKQLCHYGILYINIYVYLYNSSWMTSRLGRNMTPGCCYLNSLKSISNHHHLHWKVKENDIEDMWRAKPLFEPISAEYYPSITRVLGVLPKYCLSIQSITRVLPEYSEYYPNITWVLSTTMRYPVPKKHLSAHHLPENYVRFRQEMTWIYLNLSAWFCFSLAWTLAEDHLAGRQIFRWL